MMTTINKVIIIGAGDLGRAIALKMSESGREVTLIDQHEAAFKHLSTTYGGNTALADGTLVEDLKLNDIEHCDLLISATENDKTNLFIALLGARYFHVPQVYVRLYNKHLNLLVNTEHTHVICPAELSVKMVEDKLALKRDKV